MPDIAWLLDRIESGPEGPQIGAFFDFDQVIVDCYSATLFFEPRTRTGDLGFTQLIESLTERRTSSRRGRDVSELIRIGASRQAGTKITALRDQSRETFETKLSHLIYPEARMMIDAHHRMGHTVVIATSGLRPLILPAAEDLGIQKVIATEMVIDKYGRYSGALDSPVRWGKEKAAAVKAFAKEEGIRLKSSFGYANGAGDIPFLELVGNPCAINADSKLRTTAGDHGWPSARLRHPAQDRPIDVVRSAAAVSAMGAIVGAAAGVGIARGSRSAAANFASGLGSDVMLRTAGVTLNVVGEENLWSQRPAVFLFNHQSQLDVLVLGALLRENFTGVAKKSLEKDPFFGPIGWLANVAFIDRSNNAKAREALEPVVAALKEGRSLAVAPEGTRSPTPRLLPFKKGPFHIAMQAEVPLVPIVMRNCGEIMAAHSYVVHPGVVDVAVLPPVDTRDWDLADLDEHIAQVRDMYLQTLSDWPTAD